MPRQFIRENYAPSDYEMSDYADIENIFSTGNDEEIEKYIHETIVNVILNKNNSFYYSNSKINLEFFSYPEITDNAQQNYNNALTYFRELGEHFDGLNKNDKMSTKIDRVLRNIERKKDVQEMVDSISAPKLDADVVARRLPVKDVKPENVVSCYDEYKKLYFAHISRPEPKWYQLITRYRNYQEGKELNNFKERLITNGIPKKYFNDNKSLVSTSRVKKENSIVEDFNNYKNVKKDAMRKLDIYNDETIIPVKNKHGNLFIETMKAAFDKLKEAFNSWNSKELNKEQKEFLNNIKKEIKSFKQDILDNVDFNDEYTFDEYVNGKKNPEFSKDQNIKDVKIKQEKEVENIDFDNINMLDEVKALDIKEAEFDDEFTKDDVKVFENINNSEAVKETDGPAK